MENSIGARVKRAWNVFMNKDPTYWKGYRGPSTYYRPDRPRFSNGRERSIVTAVLNRISVDTAAVDIRHVRVDENKRFMEEIDSAINNCLTIEANIDQSGRAFRQDVVMSMLDEGAVALVPVDTDIDPESTESYKINTIRTGKIVEWYPRDVRVNVYNDRTGQRKDVVVPKSTVAIVENPFYAVMNEPSSTLQRLIRKLALLDIVDERTSSGKLDLIIQLPYTIKSEALQKRAEKRRSDIETQLTESAYGIAYIDGTEKVVQLNRAVENNLMKQIEYLTSMLYSQLGITQAVMDGTADEATMLNYNNRIIEPILSAICDAMIRSFLTKTARSQRQTFMFFKDPFKLVPVSNVAEIADKFTRNEIMTSNEIRQIVGMIPSDDPSADELRNKNLSQPKESTKGTVEEEKDDDLLKKFMNSSDKIKMERK